MLEEEAFVSFSGGKESCLACYRAIEENFKIRYLLNMVSSDGKCSYSHRINLKLLKLQAQAMGVTIVWIKTNWKNYEADFKKCILNFKEQNIKTGIFGDIDLKEHRDWIERVSKEVGIKPMLPLWKEKRENLLDEFINLGFKAIVVVTCAQFLGKEWLGKIIDKEFIKEIKNKSNIDLCGERGEYHTFVYDGPIFKEPVKFSIGKKTLKEKHWFLELKAERR
ncbi:MAG: diphthine--ammonia ligase [Candidatus Omnitrophica bacterium]|nr:diphthine--ammonia ligase [Candidatus Omnitrophota bacterium]